MHCDVMSLEAWVYYSPTFQVCRSVVSILFWGVSDVYTISSLPSEGAYIFEIIWLSAVGAGSKLLHFCENLRDSQRYPLRSGCSCLSESKDVLCDCISRRGSSPAACACVRVSFFSAEVLAVSCPSTVPLL